MVNLVNHKNPRPRTYQQALDDFGITELLSHLSNYSDADFKAQLMNLEEQEVESLAAIFIQWLTKNLNGKQIASYLNAIRYGDSDALFDPTKVEIPLPLCDLPANFPNGSTPRYKEGDRVKWRLLSNTTDWGIVIGRYYAYAKHQCNWAVGYLVKLDEDSPSTAWTVTDTAWEEDLELITDNDSGKSDVKEVGNQEDGERTLPSLEANQHTLNPISLVEPHGAVALSQLSPYPVIPKVHTPPSAYNPGEGNRTNPRTLTQQEENLIELYSNCRLGMTPMNFYAKWSVNYERLAAICDRSTSTVRRWFIRGRYYRRPSSTDLRHLAIMDFLLEYFEEIPSQLLNLLCSPNPSQTE